MSAENIAFGFFATSRQRIFDCQQDFRQLGFTVEDPGSEEPGTNRDAKGRRIKHQHWGEGERRSAPAPRAKPRPGEDGKTKAAGE